MIAGVELGGTKVVVVRAADGEIVERVRIPTTDAATTLDAVVAELEGWRAEGRDFEALGIGSFGPVGLDPARPDYGHITTTPKPGWADIDVCGRFAGLGVPIGFDTDVAGAALAEWRWGAAQGCDVVVYLTIGTGIGGGLVIAGEPVAGLVHPEHGHLRVRRRVDDEFAGDCPYHGDCIEGLASGPAIAARTGTPAEQLPADHPVWDDAAAELGELLAALVLTVSPQRIVVGGGLGFGQPQLLPRIRSAVARALGGYVAALDSVAALEQVVVAPALGDDAGPLGTIALGQAALRRFRARGGG